METISSEIQEEHQVFQSLVQAVIKLHEILSLNQPSSTIPMDQKEKELYSRVKDISLQRFSNLHLSSQSSKTLFGASSENVEDSYNEIRSSSGNHTDQRPLLPVTANLSHLVRFVKALARNKKLLTYTLSEIGFVFSTEAFQVYNFSPLWPNLLTELLRYVCVKFFGEEPESDDFLVPKWSDGLIENSLEKTHEGLARLLKVRNFKCY